MLNELMQFDEAIVVGLAALAIDEASGDAWREIGYAHVRISPTPASGLALQSMVGISPTKIGVFSHAVLIEKVLAFFKKRVNISSVLAGISAADSKLLISERLQTGFSGPK